MECKADVHILIIIAIMIVSGAFGGYLNYLHNFDIVERDKEKPSKVKYILLGIGASFLVPAFLKMISSNLADQSKNNINYLIFAGFCLIAAIFSRRFISTIGEKILEAAQKAEATAKETKQKVDATQHELSIAKNRIEDVKLAVDLKGVNKVENADRNSAEQMQLLLDLANNYVNKTSVAEYSERIKLKSELGRRMGEIIVRNQLPKNELLDKSQTEGILLAVANAVQLSPDVDGLDVLNKISKMATQLYTKYSILVAYDTLARNNFISPTQVSEVSDIIKSFQANADPSLLQKINDSLNIAGIINPDK